MLADFAYFYALHQPDAMVSVVSMVRRSSVVVSFLCGAVLFREHNLKNGIVKELVDGKEAEKGYYVDGSYEDARQ